MNPSYKDKLNCERTVEIEFICEMLNKYYKTEDVILDVGGVPSFTNFNAPIVELIKQKNMKYKICDFRGGEYKGDFVTYDFGAEKFNIIVFLSSLEHFPQCTEGDMKVRIKEDEKGFQKALSILADDGIILLTVPFGKQRWQKYHQNYNFNGILELSQGSRIIDSYVYKLIDDEWHIEKPENMEDIIYTTKAYGVGCFSFRK